MHTDKPSVIINSSSTIAACVCTCAREHVLACKCTCVHLFIFSLGNQPSKALYSDMQYLLISKGGKLM